MGHVWKTLAPDLPWASRETKDKPGASLCLCFFISWRFGQTIYLVALKLPFLSSSRILDPSVPRQTLTLPCTSTRLKWREAHYRVSHSQTEVLLKCCLRFLDKSSATTPTMDQAGVHNPQHCLTKWSTLGVIQSFFSKMELTTLTFLIYLPSGSIVSLHYSLLVAFWIPGVYN